MLATKRTTAYSLIALIILKMQVTMNLSIAFRRLGAAAGEFAQKVKKYTTLQKKGIINLLDIVENIDDTQEEYDKKQKRTHNAYI